MRQELVTTFVRKGVESTGSLPYHFVFFSCGPYVRCPIHRHNGVTGLDVADRLFCAGFLSRSHPVKDFGNRIVNILEHLLFLV